MPKAIVKVLNLFGLHLDSFTISVKPWRTVLDFLSFKGFIQSYLVKTFITHNKYLALLLKEDNYPISAKSAAQILSLPLA